MINRRDILKGIVGLYAMFGTNIKLYAENSKPNIPHAKRAYDKIALPKQQHHGTYSLEHLIYNRKSFRNYTKEPITLYELSQILWAAQGETPRDGWIGRSVPSAGALYPIELYIVSDNVNGLSNGIFRYLPNEHAILPLRYGNLLHEFFQATDNRATSIKESAVSILISIVSSRISIKYGDRAEKYANIESGAVMQNIYLQSRNMNIGTVFIGAIDYQNTKNFISESEFDISPIGVMPLGKLETSNKITNDMSNLLNKDDVTTLKDGWHLLGSSHEIHDSSIFENTKIVWKYKNDQWYNYSSATDMEFFGIEPKSGFWVKK